METNNNYNEGDVFTYEGDGFSYTINEVTGKIKWKDIESLMAFKADLLTTDEIQMTVSTSNMQLTITEETPGWETFVLKTKAIFPFIPVNWDREIIQPAFTTNLIILYQTGYHKIFADFNNADTSGRVRLNTTGALEDIQKLGDDFKENMYVLLDDDDELQIFGRVLHSLVENIWVAEIDWRNFIAC